MTIPAPQDKLPPCQCGCPNGNDVRGWLGVIAQRGKTGLDEETAFRMAWERLVEANPFPSTMGRICPHPCEAACSRAEKDGPVAIRVLERFLGDWAIAAGLPLPKEPDAPERESVAAVGGGPASLSFAYQMARRGYGVTIYERASKLGGMLRYGVPEYRLPEDVLDAEIARIVALGVDLRLETAAGHDVPLDSLRERHAALFLGIGAQLGRRLEVPGEEGPGVWTGTEFLAAVNRGEPPSVGKRVVVVGGGNTAVDAARTARRLGAEAKLLYRRSRAEMPAIGEEIDEALREGVDLVPLVSPERVIRENGVPVAVVVRTMRLGVADASGRRRPEPVPGASFRIPTDTVIAAVSQETDWEGLESRNAKGIWIGGDALGPGIAGMAIAQGRLAAEEVHRRLRGHREGPVPDSAPRVRPGDVKPEYYTERAPARPSVTGAAERLAKPDLEVVAGIGRDQFLAEVSRCFSCGLCFGCQNCWTYCNGFGFTRIAEPQPGAYFALAQDRCEKCGKCIDLCPSGYLSTASDARRPT